jgi:hypothetical protein
MPLYREFEKLSLMFYNIYSSKYFSNNYEKAIIKQQYKKRQILTKTLKLSL